MKKFLLAFLPLVMFTTLISANVDTTARIKGSVNIPGASIEAVHTPTNYKKSVVASETGNFNINFLPIGGPYRITIRKAGFETQQIEVAS